MKETLSGAYAGLLQSFSRLKGLSSLLSAHLKIQSTTKAHIFYQSVTEEKLCRCFHYVVCSALIKGAT